MANPHKIGSIDYDSWNYAHPDEARDVLGEAKDSLGRADQLAAETGSADVARIPASLAALQRPEDTRGGYRKFTEGLGGVGGGLGAAALGSTFVGAAPLGAGLGVASEAAMLPDYLRRWINPEAGEEHPGAIESALTALPAISTVKGAASLRGLRAGADEASELRGLAYGGETAPMRPWPQPRGLRPTSGGGSAVEDLMETGSFKNLPRGNVSKAKSAGAAAPDLMDEYLASTSGPTPEFSMDGVKYRPDASGSHVAVQPPAAATAGYHAQDLLDNPQSQQFMESEFARNNPIAQRVLGSQMGRARPLTAEERLASRSMERFGKKYRKE